MRPQRLPKQCIRHPDKTNTSLKHSVKHKCMLHKDTAFTMMPVRRQTPFPQYVLGTISPYPIVRKVIEINHMAPRKLLVTSMLSWYLVNVKWHIKKKQLQYTLTDLIVSKSISHENCGNLSHIIHLSSAHSTAEYWTSCCCCKLILNWLIEGSSWVGTQLTQFPNLFNCCLKGYAAHRSAMWDLILHGV